ncbi:hypothetical protein XBFM1_950004 [Xenorhabdus bovienii str. feltiae Moldova]|uniref:Uncharacterized protein n=1 Tax=Xenorhabdus bovienii str. feltiae Moldova TaxID=1398200 RepID=A0A077NZ18_XENBV|nr:hypothetical protein XBFM1_950004 [Xenorhabdus bovienii str. feltiae Moldova]
MESVYYGHSSFSGIPPLDPYELRERDLDPIDYGVTFQM